MFNVIDAMESTVHGKDNLSGPLELQKLYNQHNDMSQAVDKMNQQKNCFVNPVKV